MPGKAKCKGEIHMEIRLAREADIPQIVGLLYQVGKVHYDLRPDIFRPATLKYSEKDVSDILREESRPIFVAVAGDRVLGFGFCIRKTIRGNTVVRDMTEFYIDDLCVDETCRSQGIGEALYRHICAYAKTLNCRAVTLNVWSCNVRAMKFYERLGLQPQKVYMEAILRDDYAGEE
jgi:ribosomal protein S18 acetylase RimI-like enzyme